MEPDNALDLLNLIGDRFIALGSAIKQPETPLTELSKMALELGLTMQVRFVPLPSFPLLPNGFAGIPPDSASERHE